MAFPTIVQGVTGFAGAGVTLYSVTGLAPVGAGRAVVLLAGGDKDITSFGAPTNTTDTAVLLRSTSVSQVVAWYVAVGGETSISGTVGANLAGANLYAVEIEQDALDGTWDVLGSATLNSTELNVTVQGTGTTAASAFDGLALATWSCDSVNTAGTAGYSDSYVNVFASGNGSTQAGLWVARKDVPATTTTTCTLTRTGGTADQMNGSVIVIGKVPTSGVRLFWDELGVYGRLVVEAAWGADLTGDPDAYVWSDITTDVRLAPGIAARLGRGDEASRSQPATCTLLLDNSSGDYALGGQSALWPNVRRGTPIRVQVNPGDGPAGLRTVFWGNADGFTPGWDALGEVPVATVSASGTLRRLAQGDTPVVSPFRRAMTDLSSVLAYWPVEESAGATVVTNALGGSDMVFSGAPRFGVAGDLVATARAADAGTGAFQATVDAYTATGSQQLRWLQAFPDDGLPDGTVLAHCHLTGTLGRIDVTYELFAGPGTPGFGVFLYNSDGTLNHAEPFLNMSTIDGAAGRFSLEIHQNGADVEWNIGWLLQDPGASLFNSGTATIAGKTCGIVSMVEFTPHNDAEGYVFGQVTLEALISNLFTDKAPQQAYYGEGAATSVGRMARVCAENGIPFERITCSSVVNSQVNVREALAQQPVAPLLTILRECEDLDVGQLWDGHQPGLVMTARRYREQGTVALAIDAGAFELAPEFAPVDDDQRTRNYVEASRTFGTTAAYEDATGPLGTQVVGRYDDSVTINSTTDSMMVQHAAFRVSLGTVEGYRYPTITVDLRAAPGLAPAVCDLIPGDRVTVAAPEDVLAAFPSGTIDLLIEGISHDITGGTWHWTGTCSPASPWLGAEAAAETGDTSEFAFRVTTDGATLDGAELAGSTSISVATASGPLWTTNTDDYPLTLSIGGIAVTATACSGASSPQTMTVAPLELARADGSPVDLWDQRPLAL